MIPVATKSGRVPLTHLRMATVMASGEVAHGQMTSGLRPWDWNTFRKASQEDTDPEDVTFEAIKSRPFFKKIWTRDWRTGSTHRG